MYRMGVLAVLRAKLKKGAEIPLRLLWVTGIDIAKIESTYLREQRPVH
jgi:hypothetical protein